MNPPIHSSYLKLLLQDSGDVLKTLNSIDIEEIEDHDIKVICRTILGSVDTLIERLCEPEQKTHNINTQ